MRALWATLGLISVALGLLGAVLPLLPTVPFMLLAAYCFSRSSERLHNWLITHPRFGPAILDWRERGAINPRVKRVSTVAILAVFAISLIIGLKPLLLAIQGAVLACVMLFIWTRPGY
ncbi:MAG: YbaN family protein [Pseudomonadota bacterium]|uniref:YbaN family protein n=1 Tax=Roseovarius TaxID=74030 RepID=UPI0022A68E3C|nr:YbaN family protein [Roseovarius sp. EGI FJ00037]MCZ0811291.1 YbaN family protein [Roseovarius sp. EGI FJ00037]